LVVLVVIVFTMGALGGCSKDEAETGAEDRTSGGMPQLVSGEQLEDDAMVVKVDGRVVTNREVAEEEGRLMQQLGGRVDFQQLGEMKGVIRQQAIDNVINRILLQNAVETEGVTVSQEAIDARMRDIRGRMGSEEEFSSRLAMMGITEEFLKQEMETALKVETIIADRDLMKPISDSEMKSYYDENPEQFQQPERIGASHILIKTEPTDSEAAKMEKRGEAERLLADLKQGADFATLAGQHSFCPSKQNGGDLGLFGRGQMVKPFEDAAFSLGVGELSGIVETQFGYHIIKVTAREAGGTIPFGEAREGIAGFLDTQMRQQAMNTLVGELRAGAAIEYAESKTPPE
jgi:peptidyl-prolyl cis-trans isomerase C